MKFLDHAGLSRLSVLLDDLDVGDRLLHGSLVLFSTVDAEEEDSSCDDKAASTANTPGENVSADATGANEQRKEELLAADSVVEGVAAVSPVGGGAAGKEMPSARSKAREQLIRSDDEPSGNVDPPRIVSPSSCRKDGWTCASSAGTRAAPYARPYPYGRAGPYTSRGGPYRPSRTICRDGSRRHPEVTSTGLLADLVTTLNVCFPDYDFSSVSPEAFERISCLISVYTAINHRLSFLVERVVPGFLHDLWIAIKDAINLRDVCVYSYTNANRKVESDPFQDDDDCLFSFDYFFVDEKAKRILFFTCMTKKKPTPLNSGTDWQDEESGSSPQSVESGDGEVAGESEVASEDEQYDCLAPAVGSHSSRE